MIKNTDSSSKKWHNYFKSTDNASYVRFKHIVGGNVKYVSQNDIGEVLEHRFLVKTLSGDSDHYEPDTGKTYPYEWYYLQLDDRTYYPGTGETGEYRLGGGSKYLGYKEGWLRHYYAPAFDKNYYYDGGINYGHFKSQLRLRTDGTVDGWWANDISIKHIIKYTMSDDKL